MTGRHPGDVLARRGAAAISARRGHGDNVVAAMVAAEVMSAEALADPLAERREEVAEAPAAAATAAAMTDASAAGAVELTDIETAAPAEAAGAEAAVAMDVEEAAPRGGNERTKAKRVKWGEDSFYDGDGSAAATAAPRATRGRTRWRRFGRQWRPI